jgi:hypothetical protein
MPSHKHLNGAAYDIMHHAVSGLSFLHPHIAQTCRAANIPIVTLDLMQSSPLPSTIHAAHACVTATQTLHQTFVGILQKLGFSLSDVSSATLTFRAPRDAQDDYTLACSVELVTADGKRYHHEQA